MWQNPVTVVNKSNVAGFLLEPTLATLGPFSSTAANENRSPSSQRVRFLRECKHCISH